MMAGSILRPWGIREWWGDSVVAQFGRGGLGRCHEKDATRCRQVKQPVALAVADLRTNGSPDLIVTKREAHPSCLKMLAPTKTTGFRSTSRAWMTTKMESALKSRSSPEAVPEMEMAGASGYLGQNSPY